MNIKELEENIEKNLYKLTPAQRKLYMKLKSKKTKKVGDKIDNKDVKSFLKK
jgi:hypothetical protein